MGLPVQAQTTQRLGVFGLVEGLDPLVVAGQQVNVPADLHLISPLGPDQTIALGDTLAITAQLVDTKLTVTRMLQIFPVVGPVGIVDAKVALMMGSAVHIPPDHTLKSGAWFAISGLWSGETVITTKARGIGAGGFAHLTGVVSEDGLRLGGSDVLSAQAPKDGFGRAIWSVSGAPSDDGIRVSLLAKGVFGGPVDLTVWQGYASGPIASQTYMVHGTGVMGTALDAQMPEVGALITRCAQAKRVVNAAPDGMEAAFDILGCANRTQAD